MFTRNSKPRLLMISHCLPEPCGDSQSARSWQLLKLAQRTYDVDLACASDSPVNLKQWRNAAALTHKLSLDTCSTGQRLMSHLWHMVSEPAGVQKRWHENLRRQLSPWLGQHSYDAVLCTHWALWDLTCSIPCPHRIFDMDGSGNLFQADSYANNANNTSPPSGAWATADSWHHQRSMRHLSSLHQRIAGESDLLTTSHRSLCDELGWSQDKVHVLPRAVDLSWFTSGESSLDAPAQVPRLMLHTSRPQRTTKVMHDWFAQNIWQKVKRAVPDVQWTPNVSTSAQTLDALKQATVILSPQAEPAYGQWAVLQAMALSRPVIASRHAVSHMDVRHGEHLLVSQHASDWVEMCVESLRSARVRLKLARAGRAFVEANCCEPLSRTLDNLTPVKNADLRPAEGMSVTVPLAMAA